LPFVYPFPSIPFGVPVVSFFHPLMSVNSLIFYLYYFSQTPI
jgi:hypothetical protein